MMTENLIECPRCKGNACSEMKSDEYIMWLCMGCGWGSNSTLTEDQAVMVEAVMPNLYKDLKFIDESGFFWYPNAITLDDKSMVFVNGSSVEDWVWSAVKSSLVIPEEKEKYLNAEFKTDMTTIKDFGEDFMNALEYIGYFG